MICPSCDFENEEKSLFCRNCLDLIKNFSLAPGFIDKNFHYLRLKTVEFLDDKITSEEYLSFLDDFKENIDISIKRVDKIQFEGKISDEIESQEKLTREGLNYYTKAIDVLYILAQIEKEDLTEDVFEKLVEALILAEEGNYKLNAALNIINEQVCGSPTLMFNESA